MNKKSLFVLLVVFFLSANSIFAQIEMISPVEGIWANKQMLVIENKGDGDFFYSVDGSDPEAFGFAYDGPVMLDVNGVVKLNVTHIRSNKTKETASVTYSVYEDDASKTNYSDLVKTFYDSGILNYSAGAKLKIPENLFYSFGLPPDSFIKGRTLSLSSSCILSRYIPCTIFDKEKNLKYRFIIRTLPQNAGIFSHRDVPFKITDWETIDFIDNSYIFKIDSEYWGLPSEPRKIDRTVSHMISWQSIDYDASNPIDFFVLPPKPEIIETKHEDDSVIYTIAGDSSYAMSILNQEKEEYTEFFTEAGVDVFYGDRVSGKFSIGIFSDSVYQGNYLVQYDINKRPPSTPDIKSNADSFYSRDDVTVKVKAEQGNELYIALSEPYKIEDITTTYNSQTQLLKNIEIGEFKKAKKDSFSINWKQNSINPVYYKLAAYSKNGKNQSEVVEYSVIIDQSNYYFDEKADDDGDGTLERPFNSFEKFENALSSKRVVKLHTKGNMHVNKNYKVSANFEIINDGDARFVFEQGGSLEVSTATLELNNCQIQKKSSAEMKNEKPLIKLENSVLTIKDCIISANFTKNGTIIDSYNSIINISGTIGSANAISYASFISSVKSRLNIKNSSLSTNASTNVVISANGGTVASTGNTFTVSGKSGRIAELFDVKASFVQNKYKSNIKDSVTMITPVYKNKNTKLTEKDNEQSGF
ncbi:hypothetical protein [Treponema sp. Marseille-Q3903]|uniref:hypothetical protein n=1 Tax=Treponema sp. Marseille-Q3903 TaxID=2766703 RepID=UPI0016521E0B|nr:hypothetical protein [Treponema sp. Marseille-Q3903]MBC6713412.1 hypothetical protein [Treponema sp. Marseille-Q3903]